MSERFLRSSDLSAARLIDLVDRRPLLEGHAAVDEIVARAPELRNFFAEPVVSFDENGDVRSAKWYTAYDHEARRIHDLTRQKREQASRNLAEKLNAAAAYLDDPDIGPLMTAMLNIVDLRSVYFLGTQPVLTDWATMPVDAGDQDPRARLAILYPDVFGGDKGGITATGATTAAAPATAVVASDDMAAHTAANVIYIDNTPFYHRTWVRFFLFGFLLLSILWLLWWLLYARPGGILVRSSPDVIGLHDGVIDGLSRERDRLKGLLETPCTPEASHAIGLAPTGPIEPAPPAAIGTDDSSGGVSNEMPGPALATPPSQPATQPEVGTAPDAAPQSASGGSSRPVAATTLAHRLERSVALIVAAVPSGGVTMGSGFFVTKDMMVTNRHVIENADRDKIAVTSETLGRIQRVNVVATSASSEIGQSDYALLKLRQSADVDPLTLSTLAEKLTRVIAAGYPGYLTNLDPDLRALIAGDLRAAPEMVFTSGEISVVQNYDGAPPIVIHTADMSQGNSGGPLVDQCGRVVGVNTFIGQDGASDRRGLFALGASDLRRFLDENNVTYRYADSACGSAAMPAANSGSGG